MSYRRLLTPIICVTILMLGACQESTPSITESEEPKDMETSKPIENGEDQKEEILHLPQVNLQKGDEGDKVTALQHHIIQLGYPIETTGVYDEDTTWAITDFQLHHEALSVTGVYEEETRQSIEHVIDKEQAIEPGKHLAQPTKQNNGDVPKVVENPYEILSLVNKQHALPSDYIPDDLVIPDVRFPFTEDLPQKQLRKIAADALEELFAAGDEAGMDLFALSGYRSYDRQDAIFAANVDKHGEEVANTFSARPGESEHQSGLTMDVTCPEVGYDLTTEFGETKEGKWIKEHAGEFGFIVRYPEEKQDITEYQYEPWHLRYVGEKAAIEIMEKGITLEEYLGVK